MVTFLAVLLMVCTFLNLLGFLEYAIILRTSTRDEQDYRYHKLRKTFLDFIVSIIDRLIAFNDRLKTLLCEGLFEPEFYGDIVYK